MNHTICDSHALENDLSPANGDRRTGVVTMAMIRNSLSLFESQEVITVIGSMDLTFEQASRLRPLDIERVDAFYPDLVYHLREVLFYTRPLPPS
jgi:hypothetical protein